MGIFMTYDDLKDQYASREDEVYAFFSKTIETVDKYANIDPMNISFETLNAKMSTFYQYSLSINGLKAFIEHELQIKKRRMRFWYAEKHEAIRRRENLPSMAGSKWITQKEVENMVMVEHKEEYLKLITEVEDVEAKLSFIKSMSDLTSGIASLYQTMSSNIRSEVTLSRGSPVG